MKMSAVRSTIWWTVPNIQGTSIYLTFAVPSTDTGTTTNYSVDVKIPKGLYGYQTLNTLIDAALELQHSFNALQPAIADFVAANGPESRLRQLLAGIA